MSADHWTDDIKPMHLVQFFRSIPSRLPASGDKGALERHALIGRELVALNALTLGRSPDFRVAPDLDDLAGTLADRFDRYGSSDWDRDRNGEPTITQVRRAVGTISVELRAADVHDDASGDDDRPESEPHLD